MENNTCSEHQKELTYFCLNKNCTKNSICCFLCIKNHHNKCSDELIIEKEEAKEMLKFKEEEINQKSLTSKINQIIELKIFELNKNLLQKKKNFINSFILDRNIQKLFNEDSLREIKKNFKIKYNSETTQIDIS